MTNELEQELKQLKLLAKLKPNEAHQYIIDIVEEGIVSVENNWMTRLKKYWRGADRKKVILRLQSMYKNLEYTIEKLTDSSSNSSSSLHDDSASVVSINKRVFYIRLYKSDLDPAIQGIHILKSYYGADPVANTEFELIETKLKEIKRRVDRWLLAYEKTHSDSSSLCHPSSDKKVLQSCKQTSSSSTSSSSSSHSSFQEEDQQEHEEVKEKEEYKQTPSQPNR